MQWSQRLYPQCQSCFQQQGSAVREGVHRLVYSFRPRMAHLAPGLSVILCAQEDVRRASQVTVDRAYAQLVAIRNDLW